MIYKIILNKTEVQIDEEDKNKIVSNIDKNFIILKSGEVINPSFVQGIIIDHEASRHESKQLEMKRNTDNLSLPRVGKTNIKEMLDKYKPNLGE